MEVEQKPIKFYYGKSFQLKRDKGEGIEFLITALSKEVVRVSWNNGNTLYKISEVLTYFREGTWILNQ